LERMEVPFISVCSTPSDIVELPCLSVLILPVGTTLPHGIGKMKSLRTLKFFTLEESSPENIKGLGELKKLEELRLDCGRNDNWRSYVRWRDGDTSTAIWMDALFFSSEKLSNLKFFELVSYSIDTGADALSLLSPPFHNLESLHLQRLIFSRVPRCWRSPKAPLVDYSFSKADAPGRYWHDWDTALPPQPPPADPRCPYR